MIDEHSQIFPDKTPSHIPRWHRIVFVGFVLAHLLYYFLHFFEAVIRSAERILDENFSISSGISAFLTINSVMFFYIIIIPLGLAIRRRFGWMLTALVFYKILIMLTWRLLQSPETSPEFIFRMILLMVSIICMNSKAFKRFYHVEHLSLVKPQIIVLVMAIGLTAYVL